MMAPLLISYPTAFREVLRKEMRYLIEGFHQRINTRNIN